jgi:catechol 2,3-dioxygenase-like lactoylglutathione lyase family enzyme
MQSPLVSLHHVTATVDGAQEDLDFAAGALGLRLVKQTVNFDNHNVFHFYYGDAAGSPGTLWTTFPYRGWGVRAGTIGAGQVTTTAFSVPQGSLDAWRERLAAAGATVGAMRAGTMRVSRSPIPRGCSWRWSRAPTTPAPRGWGAAWTRHSRCEGSPA